MDADYGMCQTHIAEATERVGTVLRDAAAAVLRCRRKPVRRSNVDWKKRLGRKLTWRVDEDATSADALEGRATPWDPSNPSGGGRVVFVDEDGEQRRLPDDMSQLRAEERDAAIAGMAQALGAGPPDQARMAAIERLTELRAAGKISEEQFHKERRRLEDY